MSFVKCGSALFPFSLLLLKAFSLLSFFVPFQLLGVFKTLSWLWQGRQPLLFLLSVRSPNGMAPFDSYGHGQETSAPNL